MTDWRPGDSTYNILWKLLENAGGTPRPGDSEQNLLAKYLTQIGGTPMQGDTFYDVLVKIVRAKGGIPQPGDLVWGLLVRWLEAEGECRACGDSVYDLWRKILGLGESEPPAENGLLQGLTAYWAFDEASGTRVDSHGTYDLAQTGSVSATAAALNNGAEFFASELDYLANTSADLGTHGGSFSISMWVRPTNIVEGGLMGKGAVFGDGWWRVAITATPSFALDSSDTDFNSERCEAAGTISAGVMYHVAARYDAGTGIAAIWVNGVKTEDSHLAASDNVQAFKMGNETTHVIDETALWIGRAISDADVALLYNGGVPLPYGDFTL